MTLMRMYCNRDVERFENLEGGGASCNVGAKNLGVEMGFTWAFPRNQDAKVKLKSELISIKF